MKRLPILFAALLLPALGWAQAGIRNSDHDLSNSSTAMLHNSAATENQICKYCHTPHRAQSTQFLWNHSPTANTAWTWGNDLDGNALTTTTTGTTLPSTLRAGSKRCLGCHDGSVAIGDVSNAGDGVKGIIPGLVSVGTCTYADGTSGPCTDATGHLADTSHLIGASGAMGGNHPVSIPYAGQTGYNGISSSVPAAWLGGAIGGYFDVTTAGCTSTTGVCTTAPQTDGRDGTAINLIPNVAGGKTNVGVECSTCHEPHNKYGFGWFTRVNVENASGLCRSCHNK